MRIEQVVALGNHITLVDDVGTRANDVPAQDRLHLEPGRATALGSIAGNSDSRIQCADEMTVDELYFLHGIEVISNDPCGGLACEAVETRRSHRVRWEAIGFAVDHGR